MSQQQKDDLFSMVEIILSNSRHHDDALLTNNQEVSRKLIEYIEAENLMIEHVVIQKDYPL